MSAIRSNTLRTVIAVDAAACGLAGVGLAIDAPLVAPIAGMPEAVLQPLGLFLIGYAAVLAFLASRAELPRAVVWTLVAFNVAWAVESVMAPVLGWAAPTGLGLTLILVQAAGALLVADLQYLALRRMRREAMA